MTPFYLQPAQVLVLKDKTSAQKFSSQLTAAFPIKWLKNIQTSITFLDSFDGRLFNAGFTLMCVDNRVLLKSDKAKDRDILIDWPGKTLPGGTEDFGNSALGERLKRILGVRNFSRILTLKIVAKPFAVMNNDQKTIARGYFLLCRSNYPQHTDNISVITVAALRGYSEDLKALLKQFPGHFPFTNFNKALFTTYAIDLKDHSKPSYDLKGKSKISRALFEILYKNFLIVRRNENGIIDDIDIEFLHDYRVACRRMRSALSLIKGVIDPQSSQMLKIDLKHLGNYSGPLRDLDVYLLREDEYKVLLPDAWPQKDIHAIFVKLKSQRNRAHNKMAKLLRSPEYKNVMQRWDDFFKNYDSHIINDAALPGTASSLIMKWFKRTIKGGRDLSARDPDEKFHNLRISCKKLRYLLEFFGPLYPPGLIKKAVQQLKKLQENLGEFNDYSVQIETLDGLLNRSSAKNTDFVKTVAGLITVLDYKMQHLRNEFYELFEEFSSAKNMKIYSKILGQQ